MRLVRGRRPTPESDRAATAAMVSRTGTTGEEAFRAWTPHRQVAFGRRDTNTDGYSAACTAARERNYAVIERSVGGQAVAYTGSTVAFAHALPLDDPRRGLTERYEAAVDGVVVALHDVGVEALPGEPPDAFCPGEYSVQAPNHGGKLSGIAQRIQADAALVAGCVLVRDRAELVDVLTAIYEGLDTPFDPASVGTVADAGGTDSIDAVCRALERSFIGEAGDPDVEVESVDALDGADGLANEDEDHDT